MGASGTCTSGGLPLRGHETGGPRAPPSRRKLAGESLMAPAFQFCPLPGLRRGSQCQRGRAAFHLPNVVAWGSTAKAAIAAAAAATLRSGPSRFSKNGGKSPAGRGALPDGVTSLPGVRRPDAPGAGAVLLEWGQGLRADSASPRSSLGRWEPAWELRFSGCFCSRPESPGVWCLSIRDARVLLLVVS